MSKRGPKIPDEVKHIILNIVLYEDSGEARSNLVDKAKERIEPYLRKRSRKDGTVQIIWPEDETIAKLISQYRRHAEYPEDRQWNLGVADTEWGFEIPPEKLAKVIQVWKYCKQRQLPLTIRQVKWAVRLSAVISDPAHLCEWASVYANRELACLILRKPRDTSDLEPIWAMSPWEMATAYIIDMIEPLTEGYYHITTFEDKGKLTRSVTGTGIPPFPISAGVVEFDPEELRMQSELAENQFLLGPDLKPLQFRRAAALIKELQQAGDDVNQLEDIATLGLSYEAERVYTLWLLFLQKGPAISKLSMRERLDILVQLRYWIKNHTLATDSEVLVMPFPWLFISDPDDLIQKYDLKPIGLLAKVGYEYQAWDPYSEAKK